MSTAMELFIIGITVSFGPCLAFCTPVILPYIAATRRGWREGLKTTLIFLFTRLIVYVFLGLLAGLFGRLLTEWFHQFRYLFFFVGGLIIALFGILIILGKEPRKHLCQIASKHSVDSSEKGDKDTVMLGFSAGFIPCLPLLGVLAYIALMAQNLWQGAFYGFAFGAGKFISPLIPLGILASVLPAGLIKNPKVYGFFSRICGIILFFVGVNLIVFKIWR